MPEKESRNFLKFTENPILEACIMVLCFMMMIHNISEFFSWSSLPRMEKVESIISFVVFTFVFLMGIKSIFFER